MDVLDCIVQHLEKDGDIQIDNSHEWVPISELCDKIGFPGNLAFELNSRFNTVVSHRDADTKSVLQLVDLCGAQIIDRGDSDLPPARICVVVSDPMSEWKTMQDGIRKAFGRHEGFRQLHLWTCPGICQEYVAEKESLSLAMEDTKVFIDARDAYVRLGYDAISSALHELAEHFFYRLKFKSAIRFESTCWNQVLSCGRWENYEVH